MSRVKLCDFELKPLAEESLGVRSMSILVSTPEATILLDPGVSLAPRRFGLPPHPEEFRALLSARMRLIESAEEADFIVITHYHRDHFTPPYESLFECSDLSSFESIYKGKRVLAKSIEARTPFNQKKRAWRLFKALEKLTASVTQVNESEIRVGGVVLRFFPCVHGDPRLGYVLVVQLTSPESCSIVYAPDVQGPADREVVDRMLEMHFELAIIGGPPLYLETSLKKHVSSRVTEGLENLARIVQSHRGRVVVAHHLLRSVDWVDRLENLGVGEKDVHTYSSLLGLPMTLLEANRKLLFESDPPPPNYGRLLSENRGRICSKLLEEIA